MSVSLIVQLLAQRSPEELARLREQLRTDLSRLTVELAQVDEALARQARRGSRHARDGSAPSKGTKQRIIDVLASRAEPLTPAAVFAELQEQGASASRGSVHTTLSRLLGNGTVERVGEVGDSRYKLASRNGAPSGGPPGPSRNEDGEPLFTATHPQEGT